MLIETMAEEHREPDEKAAHATEQNSHCKKLCFALILTCHIHSLVAFDMILPQPGQALSILLIMRTHVQHVL